MPRHYTLAPISALIWFRVSAALGSRLRARGRTSTFDIVSMTVLISGNANCINVKGTVLRSAKFGEGH